MRCDDPKLALFEDITIFDLTFGLVPQLVTIENQGEYLSDLVRTMKSEFRPYRDEFWYVKRIREARKKYPEFEKLWDAIPDNDLSPCGMGNVIPIVLRVPHEGVLKFRLLGVHFANDRRFRVVQWIPVDEITALKCLVWKQEEDSMGDDSPTL